MKKTIKQLEEQVDCLLKQMPSSFAPTGEWQVVNTVKDEIALSVAGQEWPSPWEQDEFVAKHGLALEDAVKAHPVCLKAQKDSENLQLVIKELEELKESAIFDITGGLDRETVMELAEAALDDARGYWPEFTDGKIIVRNTKSQYIYWGIGDDGWSTPVYIGGSIDHKPFDYC
jgi:hypothetical protein